LKLAGRSDVPGYTSLLVTITFLSGIQRVMLGMVGQYVARIYDEVRNRPLYLVREARGFGDGSSFDARGGVRGAPLVHGAPLVRGRPV
jgi:dolichol-phosphate mannosyltransferase